MLSGFPTPYPDELLYSILARYHLRSTNISAKAVLKDLFGSTTVIATYDLPSHLESLVSNLPLLSAHTVESFIEHHTLYPLYAPFLPPERALLISNSMRNHFQGDIHTRIGIMAGAIPVPAHFRFCPACLQEEIKKYGEPYWHRLHQVAGIRICPTHRVLLQDSTVMTVEDNRHEFCPADESNCLFRPVAINYSKDTFNRLLILAQDTEFLLNTHLQSRTGECYRKKYQSLLIDKRLATASGRVFQAELLREFSDFYGLEFLTSVHSNIEKEATNSWLSDIVRKHRKTFHPIRHLLLIRFLGQSVKSFSDFSDDQVFNPFGDGPWVCFNGSSNHYLERKIKSLAISYSHDAKKLIGTFSCRCGFVYSTSRSSVPYSDKLHFGKIKSFGKMWERKLAELLINQKKSFRKTAKCLKVDTNTVINHVKRLNLIPVTKEIQETNPPANSLDYKRKVSRNAWKRLKENNPCLGKTELRKIHPGAYIWLYRNDKKWLDKNSPKKSRTAYVNKRVNWSKRDIEIFILTKKAVKSIFQSDPPVRVTISAVGKRIGFRSLFEKHMGRLPKTLAFLSAQVETVEVFQIRRISWAIIKLDTAGETIIPWKIVRLAGLKKVAAERLHRHVEQAISRATLRKLCGRKWA